MGRIIHSKALVFGLPTVIFLIDVALTVSSRQLVEVTSSWMHLAGGFSMGLLFLYFWDENLRSSGAGKNILFSVIAIVAFAVLIGVFWEFAEFSYDKLLPELAVRFPTQPSVDDTIADLLLDLLGGLAVAFLYCNSKLYKEFSFNK